MYKSKAYSNIGSRGVNSKNSDRSGIRHSFGTSLIDEEEYKYDHNQIFNDDSKFARHLKKLLREDEEDRKLQKILDLSNYLDQQENFKFVLKLGRPALNFLLKLLLEQSLLKNIVECIVECMAKIGSMMINDRDPHKYFDWLIEKLLIQSSDSKEIINRDNMLKIFLLNVLQMNFRDENFSWYLKENITYILDELKKLLETVESPNLMMKLVKTIFQLSRPYFESISRIFEDVVDILIAWHIDSTQPEEIIAFTSNSLVYLRSFWLKKLGFTVNLLEQFIEDIESYVKIYVEDSLKVKELENIEKTAALFRVYNTVVKSISCVDDPNYKPLKYILNPNEANSIMNTFHRLLDCLAKFVDSSNADLLFEHANQSIALFYEIFDEKIFAHDDQIISFVMRQNQVDSIWSNEVDSSYLRMISKILIHYISSNNTDLIKELTSFEGRLWHYRFSPSANLVQESLNIYKQIIVVKSIPIIQEVYKNVLLDSELSFATILKYSSSSAIANMLLVGNHEADESTRGVRILDSFKNAETSLLFNLCVLAELGNASKTNLISMYAISPPLFEIFTIKLCPCNWTLAENFPHIQFDILSKFFAYCSKHDYFIANSSLFSSGSETTSLFVTNSITREYFKIIVETAARLLEHPSTPDESVLSALNVISRVIDLISLDYGFVFESALFSSLYNHIVTVAYYTEEIALLSNRILLKTVVKFERLNESLLTRVMDLCKYYAMSSVKNLRDYYIELLCSIPINISISQIVDYKSLNSSDFSNFSSIARHNYVLSSSDSILTVQSFKSIIGFVLTGILNQNEIYAKQWLERILYSSKRNSPVEKTRGEIAATVVNESSNVSIENFVETHQGLLWFWALWECAQFCVQSKLKTPLGKATDTFITIETSLKNYFIYENQPQSQQSNPEIVNAPLIDLNRLSLLLHFVEYLEKIVYMAYEGLVTGPQITSKSVKIFFRTNKATCNEWFWRVRFCLITISCKSGHYELAIRHSYEYIQHCILCNLTSTNEFEQVIVLLVKSLTKLKLWQSLIGLQKWLNQTVKKPFDWILSAIEEAKESFENACSGYKDYLKSSGNNTTSEKPPQSSLVRFLNERIFESYFQLRDWNEYLKWYEEYRKTPLFERFPESESLNLKQQIDSQIDINYIKSLASFEEGNFELCNGYLKQMKSVNRELLPSNELLFSRCECKWNVEQIERAFFQDYFISLTDKRQMHQQQKSTSSIICENMANEFSKIVNIDEMSFLHHQKLMLTQFGLSLAETNLVNRTFPLMKSKKLNEKKHDLKYLNFVKLHKSTLLQFDHSELNLSCARLARKQANFNMASRLIIDQFNQLKLSNEFVYSLDKASIIECYRAFSNQTNQSKAILSDKMKLALVELDRETCKLVNAIEHSKSLQDGCGLGLDSIQLLAENIFRFSDDYKIQNAMFTDQLREKHARSLLTLTKWIESDLICRSKSWTADKISTLVKLLSKSYISSSSQSLPLNLRASPSDMDKPGQLGDLLDLATVVAPGMAKTWYALADWSFRSSGRHKAVDLDDLDELIPSYTSHDEREIIKSLFSTTSFNFRPFKPAAQGDVESSLCQQTAGINLGGERLGNEVVLEETRCLLAEKCPSLGDESIRAILETYEAHMTNCLHLNKIACNSYFTFLQLCDKISQAKFHNQANITATLRILKLSTKQHQQGNNELRETLVSQFARTPTHPWKSIIPQLFGHLNHDEPSLRRTITDLLFRIANDYPHLIIYPAVVGCQEGPTRIETVSNNNAAVAVDKDNVNENKDDAKLEQQQKESSVGLGEGGGGGGEESDASSNKSAEEDIRVEEVDNEKLAENESDEGENEEEIESKELESEALKSELKTSYKILLDTLNQAYPKVIDQVKLFVHEMRRITLLREELWLGTLNQIHSDISKRIDQLSSEVVRLYQNESTLSREEKQEIMREKYEIILMPILTLLEHVKEITLDTEDQTPNEAQFRKDFARKIEAALTELGNKLSNATRPIQAWHGFKQLHSILHMRSQQRQCSTLSMDVISPKLAALKSTSIPLPGKDGGHQCTIYSVSNSVYVLQTKTKPKKLLFVGSNGRRYPYLFKGLEDLHLDERIMQLLSIVNALFSKINKNESIHYHALNYSVTPLGPRSGLISWVEGATPLFTLYKRWQQREAIYLVTKQQQQQQQQQHQVQQPQIQIARPNDLYYAKLNPLLKEAGVKNFQEARQQCPTRILRQALEELIKETPGDLLAKELWCNSSTPAHWLKTLQIYSRSTAVMSMIGYIIGLGDRHLDNVLVNMSTGEVAHIDYNICFEKGHNLRVPERVPFRLTQNVENALGVTKVEGIFRVSCENAMSILRAHKDVLLTLLEAFVDDPLLDWQAGNDAGIIASFYGGGAAKIAETKPSQQTNAQKNSKESRKNLEKKLCYRLYSIRLVETRSHSKANKEKLTETLSRLLVAVSQLCEFIEKINQKESQIRLHEQSKIYLDESLTLHSEISGKSKTPQIIHPVYTLHERYLKSLEVKEAMKKVRLSIDKNMDIYESLTTSHSRSIQFIKSFSQSNNNDSIIDKLSPYLKPETLESAKSDGLKLERIADSIKEFMNSIGQQNVLKQYESTHDDLVDLMASRHALLAPFERLLPKLGQIYRWISSSGSAYLKSKHIQLLDWLRELKTASSFGVSFSVFTTVYTSYIQTFNRSFSLSNMSEVEITSLANKSTFSHDAKLLLLKSEIENMEKCASDLSTRRKQLNFENVKELENKYSNMKAQIVNFFEDKTLENKSSLFESFNFVQIQLLNDNLQKWLTMESVALEAKEQLVYLTSREGDWYLDEMLSLIGNCDHLMALSREIYTKYNTNGWPKLKNSVDTVHSLALLFNSLHGLVYELPIHDLMRACFEDVNKFSDMLSAIKEIDLAGFIATISRENFQQFEFLVDPECIDKLSSMKQSYTKLLRDHEILISIEKHFYKIESLFKKCHQFCKLYWTNLHQESSGLDPSRSSIFALASPTLLYLLDESIHAFYSSAFLAKKLQTVQLILERCLQYHNYMTTDEQQQQFELSIENSFLLPLRTFVSEFVVRMISGVPTVLIGNLIDCLKSSDQLAFVDSQNLTISSYNEHLSLLLAHKLATSQISQVFFTSINDSVILYDRMWSEIDLIERVDSAFTFKNQLLSCFKSQMESFEWFHIISTTRSTIEEATALTTSLDELNSKSHELIEKLSQIEANMTKRFEWASSTNTSLKETQSHFEMVSRRNQSTLACENELYEVLASLCQGWLSFEKWRVRPIDEQKGEFERLLRLISESNVLDTNEEMSSTRQLSEVELNLVEFHKFKDKTQLNTIIIQEYYNMLFDELSQIKRIKQKDEKECSNRIDELIKGASELKSQLTNHNRIMSDIKPLLKQMTRYGENSKLYEYSKSYNRFSEMCQNLLRCLSNQTVLKSNPNEAKERIRQVIEIVPQIYDGLFDLETTSAVSCSVPIEKKSSQPSFPKPNRLSSRNPTFFSFAQESNSYAVNVWKRICHKLEGRDPDSDKVLAVQDQVDYLISQATDLNNLAQLYEGWTAWV